MRYRPDLDGIRALAVLAVLASHSGMPGTQGGWMGVDVFFVLSGFLITTLLLVEHEQTGQIALRRFYARRALRLYPALLAALAVGVIFFRQLGDGGTLAGYGRTALFAGAYVEDFVLGFTGNSHGEFGHTWSLAVEEQFYLLWPLVLVVLLRTGRRVLPWAASGVLVGWLIMLASMHRSADGIADQAYYLPWSRFPQLMVGCCLAVLLLRNSPPRTAGRLGFGVASLGAMVALVLAAARFGRYPGESWEAPAMALASAALICHLATGASPLRAALGWKPLAYLGRRSYGVYIYHLPMLVLLGHWLAVRRSDLAAVMLVVSIAVAVVSYRFVERPFLRLKGRLSGMAARPPVPTTDAPSVDRASLSASRAPLDGLPTPSSEPG